jgi:hypothetical protein
MRRKQLLFSKRDKAEKATTMGEEAENQGGNLGLPNNNSKQENNQNKNNNEQKQNNENKNQNQIESIANEVGYEPKPKKSKKALEQELMELQKKLEEERNFSITETNRLNEEDNKKNIELKKLTTTYNNLIQALKAYDQSLIIRTRKISKYKQKSEEEIKKDIKVAESQIKDYEKRVNYNKENYQIFKQQVEKEMNKENDLKNDLNILKEDINSHNEEIKFLKLTSNNHLFCNNENRKLKERLANLITAYEYEIKRAKQLELIDLDKKEEDDLEIKEEYDKIDDKAKAEEDEKNLLPRINILKFRGENMQKLEMKIIKINKIGVIKSEVIGNATKSYNKLNTEFNENERYNNKEKNRSKVRLNKYSEIKIPNNYLFSEKEDKIMEKVLPENMYNSCKLKFNDILNQKKELEEKLKTESNNIKSESDALSNKCEYNKMELKSQKLDHLKLVLKSQKLRDKINSLKQDIKDMKEKINKENKKLNDENKINKYYRNLQGNKEEEE